ncbi:MAG TPA: ABC-2 family transporter protein [Candidatus Manganitrophaceae bacterium]|nr:ABC-2 family transporter protein [Candidatus Manganitrophaceae bacterium]
MRKYWTVFWVNWQNALQYRGPTFIYILGNILRVSVLLYLWSAIYREEGRLGSYSLSDLITYYLLQMLINNLVLSYSSWEIVDQIREGTFSNFLVRPVNYLHYWFTINFSWKLFEGLMIAVVGGLMSYFLVSHVSVPNHPITLLYFILALILGGILAFEFDFAIGMLAFWLVQANAFKYMLQYVVFFFAGALLPLDLFPKAFQSITSVLPFRYLVFFPIEIFLEKEPHPAEGLIGAAVWAVALYFFLQFVLRRGIARYEAVGQ